jgi:hypothetical protein
MSAADIASRAGVEAKMVRRYREQMESRVSTGNAVSESRSKVKTPRGMRPRTYRTRKKREQAKSATLYSPKINWPTREQIGAPPPKKQPRSV